MSQAVSGHLLLLPMACLLPALTFSIRPFFHRPKRTTICRYGRPIDRPRLSTVFAASDHAELIAHRVGEPTGPYPHFRSCDH